MTFRKCIVYSRRISIQIHSAVYAVKILQERRYRMKIKVISILSILIVAITLTSSIFASDSLDDITQELEVKQTELSNTVECMHKLHESAELLRSLNYTEDRISSMSQLWFELNERKDTLSVDISNLTEKKTALEQKLQAEKEAAEQAKLKVQGRYIGTFDTTAYCYGSITSTGVKPQVGVTIAVDPKVIKYGSKIRLVNAATGEEIGYRIAQDCGGAIKGNRLDIFLGSEKECRAWGHKNLKVYLVD